MKEMLCEGNKAVASLEKVLDQKSLTRTTEPTEFFCDIVVMTSRQMMINLKNVVDSLVAISVIHLLFIKMLRVLIKPNNTYNFFYMLITIMIQTRRC
jgi:hypothetical protein